jgi:hypothetical protein
MDDQELQELAYGDPVDPEGDDDDEKGDDED